MTEPPTHDLDHSARAHARLAPSAIDRWSNCPGSVRASDGVPSSSSVYAREGTAAHEMAEDCLRNGRQAEEYVGRMLGNNEFEVDEEFAEAVQLYLDVCREFMGEGWVYWFERRISLERLNPTEEISGTSDFSAYHAETKRLVNVDFKFGKGISVDV